MSSTDESSNSSSEEEIKKVKKDKVKKSKKDTKSKKSKKDTKKPKKKKKDADAPRRYLSAFIFFSKEHRATVKAENPEAAFGAIGSLLGKKWETIPPEEKKRYEKLANDDKKRWEMEKKVYDENKKANENQAESSSEDSD